MSDNVVVFTDYNRFRNPARNSRIYQALPFKFVDCDISIVIGANIQLKASAGKLVDTYLGEFYDMALFKHPKRDCVYEEIAGALTRVNDPEEKKILLLQEAHYRKIGIPEHLGGLPETGMVIRKHTPKVRRFCEAWWAEMCRWSYRDQVSFPVVLRDFPELKCNFIEGDLRDSAYIDIKRHG